MFDSPIVNSQFKSNILSKINEFSSNLGKNCINHFQNLIERLDEKMHDYASKIFLDYISYYLQENIQNTHKFLIKYQDIAFQKIKQHFQKQNLNDEYISIPEERQQTLQLSSGYFFFNQLSNQYQQSQRNQNDLQDSPLQNYNRKKKSSQNDVENLISRQNLSNLNEKIECLLQKINQQTNKNENVIDAQQINCFLQNLKDDIIYKNSQGEQSQAFEFEDNNLQYNEILKNSLINVSVKKKQLLPQTKQVKLKKKDVVENSKQDEKTLQKGSKSVQISIQKYQPTKDCILVSAAMLVEFYNMYLIEQLKSRSNNYQNQILFLTIAVLMVLLVIGQFLFLYFILVTSLAIKSQDLYDKIVRYFTLRKIQKLTKNDLKSTYIKNQTPLLQKDPVQSHKQLNNKNLQQTCQRHQKKVYYVCNQKYLKQEIYICNQCIFQKIKQDFIKDDIVCKKHRKIINSKRNQLGIQEQIFLCEECCEKQTCDCSFVLPCHYEAISIVCIEKQCIKNNQFKLCKFCTTHAGHENIVFSQESLINQFQVDFQDKDEEQSRITENYFIKIKQAIQSKPIMKSYSLYLEKVVHIIKFLESFTINNRTQVRKLIECVLKDGQKDDMLLLLGLKQKFDKNKINFLEVYLDQLEKPKLQLIQGINSLFQQFFKQFSDLIKLDEQTVNQKLCQKYSSVIQSIQDDKIITLPCSLNTLNQRHFFRVQKIQIKKQSQINYQILIIQKKVRGKFFQKLNNWLEQLFQQKKITNKDSDQLIKMFIGRKSYYKKLKGNFSSYQKQIQQFIQQFQKIQQQYKEKKKMCLPLLHIIENKFINLKFLHIQYKNNLLQKKNNCYLTCQISAFKLFQMISANKFLVQVFIKGVVIKDFQKFIKQLANNQLFNDKIGKLNWIKNFAPSKSLKLTLDAQIIFDLNCKQSTQSLITNLQSFTKLFQQLRNITIKVKLSKWKKMGFFQDGSLRKIWKCLRKIKQIKIEIEANGPFSFLSYQNNFWLFFWLSSFNQIAQLSFKQAKFNQIQPHRTYNYIQSFFIFLNVMARFIKMSPKDSTFFETTFILDLRQIFQKNTINHLQLTNCNHFPVFAKITTLQSIYLKDVKFQSNFAFMSKLVENNNKLRSIQCQEIHQRWMIDENLFDRLQYLAVSYCDSIYFGDIQSQQFSNLKFLKIIKSRIGNTYDLSKIFPKLAKINYLYLDAIDFTHQILCTIPSLQLNQLHIWNNNTITDQGLYIVDLKWPYIQYLQLRDCRKLTKSIWNICKFRGLIRLNINKQILGDRAFKILNFRGIKVDAY